MFKYLTGRDTTMKIFKKNERFRDINFKRLSVDIKITILHKPISYFNHDNDDDDDDNDNNNNNNNKVLLLEMFRFA